MHMAQMPHTHTNTSRRATRHGATCHRTPLFTTGPSHRVVVPLDPRGRHHPPAAAPEGRRGEQRARRTPRQSNGQRNGKRKDTGGGGVLCVVCLVFDLFNRV